VGREVQESCFKYATEIASLLSSFWVIEMVGETIIVTRHEGAVRWLRQRFSALVEGARVVSHISPEDVPPFSSVIGVLPITVAKQLLDRDVSVFLIQLPNVPKELRGEELTPKMMDRYGAKLYLIRSIEWEEVK